MKLGFGIAFADLYERQGLLRVDAAFLAFLDAGLRDRLSAARSSPPAGKAESDLLVELAPQVEDFLARLFGIETEALALAERHNELAPLYSVKRLFVQRRAMHKVKPQDASPDAYRFTTELDFARQVTAWLKDEAANADQLEAAARYAAWAATTADGKRRHRDGVLFKAPRKLDYMKLVPVHTETSRGFAEHTLGHLRQREGFKLTDAGTDLTGALDEANYCIWCHEQGKDSCAKGLKEKAPAGGFRKTVFGVPLAGCPLEEKISEFHMVKARGEPLAALGIIALDNPMAAATGHRICNDCMKSCIFQKQTPVNIPQIETGILTDVLNLPYGFEIYSLLTRWNPLNALRPVPLRYNGKNVLVVGMGPAGYTLAHYLLNEGFGVAGVEGLRIEPLATDVRGSRKRVPRPIRNINDIAAKLDERTILGFGGVSEYGITVRWDKNFLDVNYLVLMRRKKFRLFDGVRFGGTLTIDDAWNLGFDHIAIATGAGRPTLVPVKNNVLRGMRQASDFLMGLQASGAYKKDSLTNLQVDLPAIVIGGGLTAIDTATELMAYYVVQVEKSLDRYERLVSRIGNESIWDRFDEEEKEVFQRWLVHGRAIRAERAAAQAAGRKPDFARLAHSWGGVTLVYRKRLQDAPAYRLNHEEVIKALEEGIHIAELLSPTECVPDAWGKVQAVKFARQTYSDGKYRSTGEVVELPARSVMVAAGTHPNVIYEREHPGTFALDKDREFFQGHRLETANGQRRLVQAKEDETGFFTSYLKEGRYITFYGDNHPVFAGNVVKAMASAKKGYPEVAALFHDQVKAQIHEDQADREQAWVRFAERLDDLLLARVVDAFRLTPNIVEVVVRAPMAARHFQPGQFYRLQNYDSFAERPSGFHLTMEGIALTGAWVDRDRGLVSLIVLEMGGSSRLCALLNPGEPVVLMGPTGTPTEIPENETVLLAGGGLGNAVLFSIAEALKEKNNRVIYFAGYRKIGDLFKRREIEKACDLVVWSVDEGDMIEPRRPQDRTFRGNIVQAMQSYAGGKLGEISIPLCNVDRIISIGSDRMMNAVKAARRTVLHPHLAAQHKAIGSINSPMQCMLKEICAQCLQRHVDPETGLETIIFSCFNQDQSLDLVDFDHLRARLRQNSVAEKLTSLWIDHLFEQREVQEV